MTTTKANWEDVAIKYGRLGKMQTEVYAAFSRLSTFMTLLSDMKLVSYWYGSGGEMNADIGTLVDTCGHGSGRNASFAWRRSRARFSNAWSSAYRRRGRNGFLAA